jgi:hypothetical protein
MFDDQTMSNEYDRRIVAWDEQTGIVSTKVPGAFSSLVPFLPWHLVS